MLANIRLAWEETASACLAIIGFYGHYRRSNCPIAILIPILLLVCNYYLFPTEKEKSMSEVFKCDLRYEIQDSRYSKTIYHMPSVPSVKGSISNEGVRVCCGYLFVMFCDVLIKMNVTSRTADHIPNITASTAFCCIAFRSGEKLRTPCIGVQIALQTINTLRQQKRKLFVR